MAWVFTDDHDDAVATNHLALVADLLNAWLDLHRLSLPLLVPVDDASTGEVVGRKLHDHSVIGQDTDVVHTHLSRNMGEHLVSVIKFHPEHCVGQRLDDGALELDGTFFCGHAGTSTPSAGSVSVSVHLALA
jgi:hypothetical protein